MCRTILSAAGFVLLAASVSAQQDAGSRLHSIANPVKRVTYDVSTGTARPQKGPSLFFGPQVI